MQLECQFYLVGNTHMHRLHEGVDYLYFYYYNDQELDNYFVVCGYWVVYVGQAIVDDQTIV